MGLFDAGKVSNNKRKISIYNPFLAYRNFRTRQTNAANAGFGIMAAFGAGLSRNRGTTGDFLYNQLPTMVSGVQSPATPLGRGLAQNGPIAPTTATEEPGLGDLSGGYSTGAGTGGVYEPNLVEYPEGSGFYYDLNNPQERESFYQMRLNDLTSARDAQIASIDQEIADLTGSARNFVTNYFNQLGDLTKTKGQGDQSRINTFSTASPNAFQSSEAVSYDVANKNYLRGVGDAASQAQEAVGAGFLADPNNPALLGEDTTYGRQLVGLNQGRNQVGEEFNQYLAGIQQQNNPATNPFRFAYQSAGLQIPAAVNLSGYNPFVDFRSTPAAANPGSGFRPVGGKKITQETPIDSFLGKTQLGQSDVDFLRNYLLGV